MLWKSPDDDAISRIHFSVKDTGIGIKQQNQEKYISSFVQEDFTTENLEQA
jgi:signal transduction histidine kinase